MTSNFFTKSTVAALTAALALSFNSSAFAQAQTSGNPGVNNDKTGFPTTYSFDVKKGALALLANGDGANDKNEFIYFKVYAPGGEAAPTWDWYTNPTAWMSPYDFHFYNTNLRMYNNFIKFSDTPKARRIVFEQDPKRDNDSQFTGFGTDANNMLYQIKDRAKAHRFSVGIEDGTSTTLLNVSGSGRIQVPQTGRLEFGYSTTKHKDAGCIAYKEWSDGLEIVGAGTEWNNRVIKVWAEKGTSFNGLVAIGSDNNWKHTTPPTTLPGGVDLSSYKLFVNGGVLAKEVRVETGWADYVFRPDYKLLPLADVERHIQACGYLPGMPSAHEVEQNGVELGQMVKLQQEKIEELTLHLIAMKKELEVVNTQLHQLTPNSATK